MPDDAIERARLFLANYTIGFPLCESERQAIAHIMLAFASQQAPEGWRLVPIDPTPEIIAAILPKVGNPTDADRAVASKALAAMGVEFNLVGLTVAAELVRDYRAMLDAAPSVTLGEVG